MKYLLFALPLFALLGCTDDPYVEGKAAAEARCECVAQYQEVTKKVFLDCRNSTKAEFEERILKFKDNKDDIMAFTTAYKEQLDACGADKLPEEAPIDTDRK